MNLRRFTGSATRTAERSRSWSAPAALALSPKRFPNRCRPPLGAQLRTAARTDSHEGTFAGARCGSEPESTRALWSWVPDVQLHI